jgi:hypothetical protein
MKKILGILILLFTFFVFQKAVPVGATTTCIKATGNNVLCAGYLRCPVGLDIYCCDPNAQAECQTLQGPTTPTCSSKVGMCHLESDNCQTNWGQLDCPKFQICGTNCATSVNPLAPTTPTTSIDVSKCKNGDTGIQTAIGCIHVLGSTDAFLSDLLKWAVGIGGGIAFLLILYAGFMIMTASGDPERLKAGQELLTSAISGLILLVFSIFILKFIGIDILGLDKFGFGK